MNPKEAKESPIDSYLEYLLANHIDVIAND